MSIGTVTSKILVLAFVVTGLLAMTSSVLGEFLLPFEIYESVWEWFPPPIVQPLSLILCSSYLWFTRGEGETRSRGIAWLFVGAEIALMALHSFWSSLWTDWDF